MKIDPQYQSIIDYVLTSGKRIVKRAGAIEDIGITKAFLTEEDIAIERGFKQIIQGFGDDHTIFAEEENQELLKSKNVWVIDPISGTATFIKGLPHYAVVVSHIRNNETVFAAIYDPSMNDLYTAFKGKGTFHNGKRITMPPKSKSKDIIIKYATQWKETTIKLWPKLSEQFYVWVYMNSIALNYCYVAHGKVDGVVSLTKDVFPEFAGSLIIKEAGGRFSNNKGEEHVKIGDRIFIGGNKETYDQLLKLTRNIREN